MRFCLTFGPLLLCGCLAEFPSAPGFDGTAADVTVADQRMGDAPVNDALSGDRDVDAGEVVDAAPPGDAVMADASDPRLDAGLDMGEPPADAALRDQALPDMTDRPDACVAREEICNDIDDDCNGAIDDLEVLQAPCRVPGRDCTGQLRCDIQREAVVCDPIPDAEELCDGQDQDCDGRVDEEAQGDGEACMVGQGRCARMGGRQCVDGRPTCDVAPGPPAAEVCNGEDDDCNGIDDDLPGVGSACTAGLGGCAQFGEFICRQGNEALTCTATPGMPMAETCNQRDDDCNGVIDDVSGVGQVCDAGVGRCRRVGVNACQDGQLRCDAVPGAPAVEVCNGEDDNCDGDIDEGEICVDHALRHCRAWLGWASPIASEVPVGSWGSGIACPDVASDQNGAERCVGAVGGAIAALNLGISPMQLLDADDALAIAFTCEDGNFGVDTWIQQHCHLVLAHAADGNLGPLDPGACPAAVGPVRRGFPVAPACVSTGPDGAFHPLWMQGAIGNDAAFGVALRCEDPQQQARARGLEGGLAVVLAYTTRPDCQVPLVDHNWPACADMEVRGERCAQSAGDRVFHSFTLGGNDVAADAIGDCHTVLGIGLAPAQAN